jgi:hypothetical protein
MAIFPRHRCHVKLTKDGKQRWQAIGWQNCIGIIVVDSNGKRLTFPRALVRELGKYVSLLTFGIGFFMIGFTKKKQGQ